MAKMLGENPGAHYTSTSAPTHYGKGSFLRNSADREAFKSSKQKYEDNWVRIFGQKTRETTKQD